MSVDSVARRGSRGGGLVVRPQAIRFLTIRQNVLAPFDDLSLLQCFNNVDLVILQRQVLCGECGELSTRRRTAGK